MLSPGRNLVGSGLDSHVVLEEQGVSRRHAEIVCGKARLEVLDRGSKNGTFVNGERVARAELTVGDRLWFGPVELRLERAGPEEAQLALELQESGDLALQTSTDTTGTVGSKGLKTSGQLHLVRRFLEQLGSDPNQDAASALAVLVEELGVAGVALIELVEGREPVILTACGEVATEHLERLARKWNNGPSQSFAIDGERTALLVRKPRGCVGLMILGEFAGRSQSEPLLRTLLAGYECLRSSSLYEPDVSSSMAVPELCFPPGCVRGVAPATLGLYAQMRPLLIGDLPVLIAGETGVGKEIIAKILHASSPRSGDPFVAINCAAIPSELLEAELFGIDRGVATGVKARQGKFRLAASGTLLLDEIGEMSADLQAKLLRTLQEKVIHPVGSSSPRTLKARVLAATNANIEERMERGAFRRDLFYRLAGFVLRVPPLRERLADLPSLVERFLRTCSDEISKPVRGVTVGAMKALQHYHWPGNVRELEHEIRRLVYLCPPRQAISESSISEHILQPAERAVSRSVELPTLELAELERQAVQEAMRRSGDNQVEAAALLGISRYALRRRL